MLPLPITSRLIHFGTFAVDPKSRELFKQGTRIILQAQPFQVLWLLLEHPGDIVTREELRQALWPGDTFVDFDHGLNKVINKVRRALGDSAEDPRFIETLPKRGYRLIAPVNRPNGDPRPSNGPGEAKPGTTADNETGGTVQASPWRRRTIGVGAAAAFKTFLALFVSRKPLPNKANG
ncbi:MAG: transcriptional regulator [Acidobacteriia bacterium]|nr:transcriptional regulator [Terriglobia bacterium]